MVQFALIVFRDEVVPPRHDVGEAHEMLFESLENGAFGEVALLADELLAASDLLVLFYMQCLKNQ